ncbi:M15 family metallopeptidase [Lysobacter sp. MMG2]|nr:M15 family metallopeptidase [Lysobacter sp. MMG2]
MHGGALAAVALLCFAGCASTPTMNVSPAATPEAAGLVDLRTLVPDIDLDIRYAGHDNFTGAPVDGYGAPRCYLLAPAAQAIQRAEAVLRAQGLRLRIYDCYRPARAVRRFIAWAHDDDQRTKPDYYPALEKRDLLGEYISPTSGHSRGATIDLTLMQCDAAGACSPLDMGTPFDFFDPLANTDSPRATPQQRANRERLREAMRSAGLRNYPMEWWHYTLDPEPAPKVFFDVPIR